MINEAIKRKAFQDLIKKKECHSIKVNSIKHERLQLGQNRDVCKLGKPLRTSSTIPIEVTPFCKWDKTPLLLQSIQGIV